VVEVDITGRSVPREPIYAALGVPEIWRVRPRRIECLHLTDSEYKVHKASLVFPFLEPAVLQRFVDKAASEGETAAIEQFLAWVKKKGWG
jgi:Uma2 family endonuclease